MSNAQDVEEITLAHVHANFQNLERLLTASIPTGRELALALTNLEQAEMWAGKACYKTAMAIKAVEDDAASCTAQTLAAEESE